MPAVRVKGSRENVPLKSVPRKQILTAYVARLHSDTTEEQLTKYLTDEGIKRVVCRKIVAKNGRKYKCKSAAFRATCCSESRDKFCNENCWPRSSKTRRGLTYGRRLTENVYLTWMHAMHRYKIFTVLLLNSHTPSAGINQKEEEDFHLVRNGRWTSSQTHRKGLRWGSASEPELDAVWSIFWQLSVGESAPRCPRCSRRPLAVIRYTGANPGF